MVVVVVHVPELETGGQGGRLGFAAVGSQICWLASSFESETGNSSPRASNPALLQSHRLAFTPPHLPALPPFSPISIALDALENPEAL